MAEQSSPEEPTAPATMNDSAEPADVAQVADVKDVSDADTIEPLQPRSTGKPLSIADQSGYECDMDEPLTDTATDAASQQATPATPQDKLGLPQLPTARSTTATTAMTKEEKAVYDQILSEREVITKCMDKMVTSLSKLETDCQSKLHVINQTFDTLLSALTERKDAVINELNQEVLSQKTQALDHIESIKQYQHTLDSLQSTYNTLTQSDDDSKADKATAVEERQSQIKAMTDQLDNAYSKLEFSAEIKLVFDTKEIQTNISRFGSVLVGKPGELDYDSERLPAIIDSNLDLLLAEIPIKKLFLFTKGESEQDFTWKPRIYRTVMLFYQNKASYKVRMLVRKQEESDTFVLNQWVSRTELAKKDNLVWMWSAYDATIAREAGDEKKGYVKFCARFYDEIAFERFEDQYNQARKINLQILKNEETKRKNKEREERVKAMERAQEEAFERNDDTVETEDGYFNKEERLCFEMSVWKVYLWAKNAANKGAWKSYADKGTLQFLESRKTRKVRVVLRENESGEIKLNHWIPLDGELKSRGEQMWEWVAYDQLAIGFLAGTVKLSTICVTLIDKKDTDKFAELFDKYQKVNQKADDL